MCLVILILPVVFTVVEGFMSYIRIVLLPVTERQNEIL